MRGRTTGPRIGEEAARRDGRRRGPTADDIRKARQRRQWPYTVRQEYEVGGVYFVVVDQRNGTVRAARRYSYQAKRTADILNREIREHELH